MSVLRAICCALLLVGSSPSSAQVAPPSLGAVRAEAADLNGLWKAKRRFGPDERGELYIWHEPGGWFADFLGQRIAVKKSGKTLDFSLGEHRGSFRAALRGNALDRGQWFQSGSPANPAFGSTLIFRPVGTEKWVADVRPVDDTFTLYLMLSRQPNGSYAAFIRNPERNIGHNLGVSSLLLQDDVVELKGRRPGQQVDQIVMRGRFHTDPDTIVVHFPQRGGSFEFRRDNEASNFFPRGKDAQPYAYRKPLALNDGWPIAQLSDVDIDQAAIERFVRWIIATPMDSVRAPEVRAVLVARHGKLVLEEYFHGYSRDRLFDTRSAAKSITATLVGAAMQAGMPVRLEDPVYSVMNDGSFPADLEPRKRKMELVDLLTMRSGIHCDDGDPTAPGNEEIMLDQEDEPDFYRWYLSRPTDRNPNERSVYCSGDPNLAIGVLWRATGEHPMDLFDKLLGKPLGMGRVAWYVTPSLQPYGGGSIQIHPRDFMKFGQLMLDGGVWSGRRVLSKDFAAQASSNLNRLNKIGYGYLWWTTQFPYRDRMVQAYWAGGNGGQGIMVVPELDLVIGMFGGSYGTRVGLEIQQAYPANHILPAVRLKGERMNGPVPVGTYELEYGREQPPTRK